jgi:hypothetical protein
MDYAGANANSLYKYQWDYIHNPQKMIGLLQDDEEGEFEAHEYLLDKAVVPGIFNQTITTIQEPYVSFISLSGNIISIPSNAIDVTFTNYGTLYAFTINKDNKLERFVGGSYKGGEYKGLFTGYVNDSKITGNESFRRYEETHTNSLKAQTVNVYIGILKSEVDGSYTCKIDIYKSKYPIQSLNGINKGGYPKPHTNLTKVKEKLAESYESNSNTKYENKIKYVLTANTPYGCSNCQPGKDFFETYSSTTDDKDDLRYLSRLAHFICLNENSNTNIDILQKQIEKVFQDRLKRPYGGIGQYIKARETFWSQDNAWELYLKALENIKENIDQYKNNLGSDATELDFRYALYYLNEDFLSTLSVKDRIDVIKVIFEHNLHFINSRYFGNDDMSDESLIKKIIKTLDSEDLNYFFTEIINDEEYFSEKERRREVLFIIADLLEDNRVSELDLDTALKLLQVYLDEKLRNMFSRNQDRIVAKIVSGVKSEDAIEFFKYLDVNEKKKYYIDGAPLIYHLKERLSDFCNLKNPYTLFIQEIYRLSTATCSGNDLLNADTKCNLTWNVEQKDFLIFSSVINRNKFKYHYNSNHTVSIKLCVEEKTYFNSKTDQLQSYCTKEKALLTESSPFTLVGLTILNDISPFGAGCENGRGSNEICGEEIIVPAIFIDYLKTAEEVQYWKNVGWNTFNLVITVTTLGEGAGAISAIRAASNGTKVAVAIKNWYPIFDMAYNIADMVLKTAEVDMPIWWSYVGYALSAKTSYDLIKNNGAKGIAYLKKASSAEKKRIIDKLDIRKNGKKITEEEFDEFVRKADAEIRTNGSDDILRNYDKAITELNKLDEALGIGKNIDALSEAPTGYRFYTRADGKTWIRRIDARDPNTPRLTVRDGKIERFIGDANVNSSVEYVYHVKSNTFVQNVIDDIEPAFFSPKSRFGKGFYTAQDGETAIVEVLHHGGDAGISKVIRFSIDRSQLKVLDLTDPYTAKIWKLSDARKYEIANLSKSPTEYYSKFQDIANLAIQKGYNSIKFTSYRNSGGINLVLLENNKVFFKQVLKPQMIVPATK